MSWFSMKSETPAKARIDIYDVIGKDWWGDGSIVEAKKFITALNALGDVTEIDLHINSDGGDVFEGYAIYNELQRHSAIITVYIDARAASMASVIAMVGDKIIMPENAMMMIHDPSTVAVGNAADLQKMADVLEKIKESGVTAYALKTGQPREKISEMMAVETWMSAAEAKELGFADVIEGAIEMKSKFKMQAQFKKAPAALYADPAAFIENKSHPVDLGQAVITDVSKGDPLPMLTIEMLQKDHADLYKMVADTAATAERERIKAVMAHSAKGCESLVAEMAFDGKTTGEAAAAKLWEAHKAKMDSAHAAFVSEAPAPVTPPVADEVVSDSPKMKLPDNFEGLSLEEKCKIRWENDPEVRKMDSCFEAYLLNEKNAANMRVLSR